MSAYAPSKSSDSYESQLKALEEGKSKPQKSAEGGDAVAAFNISSKSPAYGPNGSDVIDATKATGVPAGNKAPAAGSTANATKTTAVQSYALRFYFALLGVTLVNLILSIAVLASASIFSVSGSFNGMTSSEYDCGFFWECAVNSGTRICNTWGTPDSTLETAQAFAVLNAITLFIILGLLVALIRLNQQGLTLFLIGVLYVWDFICQIIALQRMMSWGGGTMLWGGGMHVLMIIFIFPTFLLTFYLSAKGVDFERICGF